MVSSHTVHFEDTTEALAAAVARVMKKNFHSTSGPSVDSIDLKTAIQLLLHAASHTDRALKKQIQVFILSLCVLLLFLTNKHCTNMSRASCDTPIR